MPSTKDDLKKTLRDIIEYFRELFDQDAVSKKIDKAYEDELIRAIGLVPEALVTPVHEGVLMCVEVYKSVDFVKLSAAFEKLDVQKKFEIDMFDQISLIIKKSVPDPSIRATIKVFLNKCKTLIDCITLVFRDPVKYINKLADKSTKELDAILDDE